MANQQTFSTVINLNAEQASAELKKMQQHLDQLKNSRKEALDAGDTKAWKALNSEIARTEKQIGIIQGRCTTFQRTLQNLDKATPKELRQAIKDINAELNSGKVERGSQQWKDYQEALRQVKTELRNINDESRAATETGGGFLSKILPSSALETFSQLGNAFTGAIQTAKTAIAGLQEAWDRAKVFIEYNLEIERSNRLTAEFLGLTGDTLRATRSEIQAIADAYGKNFQDILTGIDTLAAQYDLTAEEAARVIRDGFQAGADLNGDMLQKIQQYAPAFHDAGISANELLGIIQQTRSGIFTDAGMNAIQMAAKRIREMSPATKEALDNIGIASDELQQRLADGSITMIDAIRQISTQLKTLPDNSQEVGEVLKDVFGRQGANAGIKLIEQLDTMQTDLETLKGTTGEYGSLLEEQVAINERLNTRMAEVFGVGENGFETLKQRGGILLAQILVKILDWFVDAYNNITRFRAFILSIKAAWQTVVEGFKWGFRVLKDLVTGAVDLTIGFGRILEGVLTLNWSKIKTGWQQYTKGIKEMFADTIRDTGRLGSALADVITKYNDGKRNGQLSTTRNERKTTSSQSITTGSSLPSSTTSSTTSSQSTPSGGKTTSSKSASSGSSTTSSTTADPYQQAIKQQEAAFAQMKLEAAHQYAEGLTTFREYQQRLADIQTDNLQRRLDIARQHGQDTTQIEQQIIDNQIKQETEGQKASLQQIEANYQATRAYLEAEFYNHNSELYQNQEALNTALAMAEENALEEKISLYKEGSEERARLEEDLMKAQQARIIELQRQTEERLQQIKNQYLQQPAAERQAKELQQLEELHNAELISETQYQEALKQIRDKYTQEQNETHAATIQAATEDVVRYVQLATQVMSAASQLFQAQQAAEEAAITAQYDRQIKAAEGNQQKQKRLEEKKQKELAAIKNKYNKRAMKMELAQAFASTAMAAINAYASGAKISPIYGAIAAAAATAAGMLQIAAIVKQHEAQAEGYYEGGFTGGRRYRQTAGIVHEGEFVANHKAVANRNIRPLLEAIDTAQRNNTIATLTAPDLMRLSGLHIDNTPTTNAITTPVDTSITTNPTTTTADTLLIDALRQLNENLSRPQPAIVQIEGEQGVARRLEQYNQMRKNI